MSITPPPPRRGGTRIFCPMVDVPATEQTAKLTMCPWHGRNTPKTRRRYRQHWRLVHWEPFAAETHALMQFVTKGGWLGRNIEATVKVTK